MGRCVKIVTENHLKSERDFVGRMMDHKSHCMDVAEMFGEAYWDGDRRYGYGGYRRIEGWWTSVASRLQKEYQLTNRSKILDVGCGKGFLIEELQNLLGSSHVSGIDVSEYAVDCAKNESRVSLCDARQQPLAFLDRELDLVIAINVLHNFSLPDVVACLRELDRIAKEKFIVVESFRNNEELYNLQCWALTCKSFFSPSDWKYVFELAGYSGDYEFIYF